MAKIALVTDSTCDLPEAVRSELRPVVVPLHFALGGVSYLDRVDMDPATFYRRFRESGQEAHSSQPSVGEFVTAYTELLQDYDSIVSVHIAGRLSGTVQSASLAAQAVDAKRVKVVDARHVSVGLGLVVQAAGEAIRTGKSLEAVAAVAEAAAGSTRVYGAVFALDVAVKGGRVSAPAAMLAGLMDIKPLIVFDEEGGTHIAGARKGFRRALEAVARKVIDYAGDSATRAVIVHADGLESAEYTREQLQARLGRVDIPIVHLGYNTVSRALASWIKGNFKAKANETGKGT